MNLLKYDDLLLDEEPSGFDLTATNVEGSDTGVSETGVSLIHVVRSKKIKIDVAYTNLTSENLSLLIEKLEQDTIEITYFYGTEKSATMHANSVTMNLVANIDGGYWNVSFTLEEF